MRAERVQPGGAAARGYAVRRRPDKQGRGYITRDHYRGAHFGHVRTGHVRP